MRDTLASTVADDVVQLIPSLRAYSRALIRHSDEADDLVQETLVKAIANVNRFEPGTNLRAWLFTIMRNTFYTSIQKRVRESPAAADCASVQAVTLPDNASYIEGQRIMAAIKALPEHHREILVLVVVLGESYEDAAVICNCAVGTIKSRVNRARKMIIDQIGVGDFHEIL
ncbi:MAG: sigma-70 family RNA polymerase sigma factor [Pseudotabrizicola sp.]|uniref:sigma-70 family RNA polymerase sigma factor n=1 Tax=Pseudotabrizicola sp. TaxID=2939647 RepID=UPI00271DFF26|nr:sigma-70 family RNA polymerase sigma factor [Pseudotabrizicola sp.]MDO9639897.1 sigma-70 family RNA polymerase sigma factor [Pseudotabrizicola sp.]